MKKFKNIAFVGDSVDTGLHWLRGLEGMRVDIGVIALLPAYMKFDRGSAFPAEEVHAKTNVRIHQLQCKRAPIAQCKSSSYMCCCGFRVPCDCSQGSTACSLREEASYAFCCSASTP